jgi:hypothetical protein
MLAARASSQAQPGNPTAPNSTSTYKMQGLAGAITPTFSGRVLVTICGSCKSSTVTAGDGILIQGSYGTGSAPTTNGALAGTQIGPIIQMDNPNTVVVADAFTPFSLTFVLTGAALATALWIDLAAKSVATASSVGLVNVGITAVEL